MKLVLKLAFIIEKNYQSSSKNIANLNKYVGSFLDAIKLSKVLVDQTAKKMYL